MKYEKKVEKEFFDTMNDFFSRRGFFTLYPHFIEIVCEFPKPPHNFETQNQFLQLICFIRYKLRILLVELDPFVESAEIYEDPIVWNETFYTLYLAFKLNRNLEYPKHRDLIHLLQNKDSLIHTQFFAIKSKEQKQKDSPVVSFQKENELMKTIICNFWSQLLSIQSNTPIREVYLDFFYRNKKSIRINFLLQRETLHLQSFI